MADKLKKASKAHTRYYLQDGTLVPGATTVTGLLNKPGLVKWANNLGLQGIDSSKYVDKAARVDSHDSINGSIVNDSTFYISESQLESGAWAETLVHEYTHFAEGSKEYGKLLGFLQSDDILVEGAEGKSIPLWQKAQEAVIRNYGFDQKRLESIVERGGKNESLSPEDMVYYNAYLSELGAHESEYLLGNEAFIDKIISKPIAKGYIETIKRNKGVKVGWFSKFFDKVFNNGKASYLQTFADPMTVARYMDKYENGFYSEMLAELRAGGIKASVLEMNIRQPLEEFLSKHNSRKHFFKRCF